MGWKSNIEENYSPDRKSKLTFYEFEEPSMMMNICRFSITDMIVDHKYEFLPIWAIDRLSKGKWSQNSRYVLLATAFPVCCFLICDCVNMAFTFVRFQNCWVLNGEIFDDRFTIEYKDDQIPERIEHDKYPTKLFSKPDNLTFRFCDLRWLSFQDVANFERLGKASIIVDFELIDNGWRKFKGELPATTELIVWELQKFAEYGDEQSKIWYNKIQSQARNINHWVKASKYLGVLKRKLP